MKIKSKILNEISNGYVLKTPLKITVTPAVIAELKSKYLPNGETGGLLWLRATSENTAEIDNITFLPNLSGLATAYSTSTVLFNNTVKTILASNYLPVVFHSHPTNLGLNLYDSRKENFYLRSSPADRRLSKDTIIDSVPLFMPEMIFVKDERYKNGFALAAYGGNVLPAGFSRLSPLQIAATGMAVYLYFTEKLSETLLFAIAGVIIYEETKRPIYENLKNGGFLIKIK